MILLKILLLILNLLDFHSSLYLYQIRYIRFKKEKYNDMLYKEMVDLQFLFLRILLLGLFFR